MNPQEASEVVATYNDYLARVETAVRHFCEDLEASNYREISGVLPAIVDGLSWLNEAIDGFVKLEKIPAGAYTDFQKVVSALHEALENQDHILLHDVMEYELLPLLPNLKILMN